MLLYAPLLVFNGRKCKWYVDLVFVWNVFVVVVAVVVSSISSRVDFSFAPDFRLCILDTAYTHKWRDNSNRVAS